MAQTNDTKTAEQQTIDDAAESIKNSQIDYFKTLSERIKDITVRYVDLHENDFRTYFLPLLLGDVELNDTNKETFYNNIEKVVGGHQVGIRVIDDDDKELFKLPPLLMGVNTDVDVNNMISYSKLINQYHLSATSQPATADKLLQQSVGKIGKILDMKESDFEQAIVEIDKMYRYYDIITPDKETITEDKIEDDISSLFDE